jgi:hypothetical protein
VNLKFPFPSQTADPTSVQFVNGVRRFVEDKMEQGYPAAQPEPPKMKLVPIIED